MKVALAVLHASVNHLFPFFCCPTAKNKMQLLSIFSGPMVYGMMLVKANILNDKETGNSKKDSVK